MPVEFSDGDGIQALGGNQFHARWQFSVTSGCAVSPGTNDLTVQCASGEVIFDGSTVSVSAQDNVSLNAADSSRPRKDTIYIDNAGNLTVATGTPDAAKPSGEVRAQTYRPAPPDLSGLNAVLLAEVWVPAAASDIDAVDVRDRRQFADLAAQSVTTDEVSLGDTDLVTIEPSDDLKTEVEGLSDNTLALVRPGVYEPTGSILPDGQTDVTVWYLPGAVIKPQHTNFGVIWSDCTRWHQKGGFWEGTHRDDLNTLWAVDNDGATVSEDVTISDFHVNEWGGSGAVLNINHVDRFTIRDGYVSVRGGVGALNNYEGRHVTVENVTAEAPANDGDAGLDLKASERETFDVRVSDCSFIGMLTGVAFGTEVNNRLSDVRVRNTTARRCERGVDFKPKTTGAVVEDVDLDVEVIDRDGTKMQQALKMDDADNGATVENVSINIQARGRFSGTGGSAVPFALWRGTYRDLDLDLKWESGDSASGNEASRYLDWQEFGTGTTDWDDVTISLAATGGCSADGLQILDDTNVSIGDVTFPVLRINGATNRAIDDGVGIVAHVGLLEADAAVNAAAGGSWRVQDTDLGSGQQSTTVAINRMFAEALGGSAPTASNYPEGYYVRDTDNAGDVYLIAGDAATQIAT